MKTIQPQPFANPYPNNKQLLLLKAAVLDGEQGEDAWKQWRNQWDPEEYLDHGSFRLLPLLYRKLAARRVEDSEMQKLKGIYRQSWCKNIHLFHQSCKFLKTLQAHQIPAMVLKGIPICVLYYADHGIRPMSDLDVLIPAKQAPECIELLKSAGWQPEYEQYIAYNLKHGRSMMFRNEDGFEADLHWYPLFESLGAGRDQDFWNDAEPMMLLDTSTMAPCPSDMLLHTLVHGLKWNPEPPIRWIPDAMAILRSDRIEPQWQPFLLRVQQYNVVLTVKEAFEYLIRHFDAPIPASVMNSLSQMPVGRAQRIIYRFDKTNPALITHGFRDRLLQLLVTYLRQSSKKRLMTQIPGFVWYLLFRTRGKSRLNILFYYLKRKIRITA